jgi:hypothetical protein
LRRARVLVAAIAVACGAGGRPADGARDSSRSTPPGGGEPTATPSDSIDVLAVNRGTQGMRSTIRWLLSPDRRAILVVEDPVSVEAEALPDGFLYASERTGLVLQRDSVWDVAPSPDWTRVALGRAYVLRAGERDTIPPEAWRRLEAALPEDVGERDTATLRRLLEAHTFPASGMSLALGFGLTQVIWIDSLRSGHHDGPTHSLHGWRVRWTPSGDTLAVGAAPRSVQDDAPPARWVLVRPRLWARYTDTLGGTTDASRFARVEWTEGPSIERASPVNLSGSRTLPVDGGTVEARDGMIRLVTRGPDGRPTVRVVGPGLPLVATAGGRFIAALVPRTDAEEHEMRAYPVVYNVRPR